LIDGKVHPVATTSLAYNTCREKNIWDGAGRRCWPKLSADASGVLTDGGARIIMRVDD